jgi:hypothetical protein
MSDITLHRPEVVTELGMSSFFYLEETLSLHQGHDVLWRPVPPLPSSPSKGRRTAISKQTFPIMHNAYFFFLNGGIKSEHLTALVWVMSQLKLLTHWGAAFIFTAQQSLVKLASNHFPHSAPAWSDSIKYNTRDCPSAEKIARVICRALCFRNAQSCRRILGSQV